MRIIVMGTGAFAVPTFRQLLENPEHEVLALVTMPLSVEEQEQEQAKRDDPSLFLSRMVLADFAPEVHGVKVKRDKRPVLSPMRRAAMTRDIPILVPHDVNVPAFADFLYLCFAPELLFVCDYGRILAPRVLAAARNGGINLHGSILPRYRGAAPVHWAILNGDRTTGISLIHMTPEVDGGPIVAYSPPIEIHPDETVLELEHRLSEIGALYAIRTIAEIATGRLPAIPQMPHEITRAPKLKKSDGLLDWERPAHYIRNHYRAMHPWPGSFTFWHTPALMRPLRLNLGPFTVIKETPSSSKPGTVVLADGHSLAIATGEGEVRVERLKPAGKSEMDPAAFMRGYPIRPGDRFGPES